MGTNFYCNYNGRKIHIGKRSCARKFLWDFQNMKTVEDFLCFLRGKKIFDEYNEEFELDDFLDMAHNWYKRDGKIVKESNIFIKDNIIWVVSSYTDFE